MELKKLFFVEFGEPSPQMSFTMFGGSGSSVRPIYVVAKDYNDASVKAGMWLEDYMQNNPESQNILDGDGSLKTPQRKQNIQIISVKLLSDTIIN